jgi:hypothetical protein
MSIYVEILVRAPMGALWAHTQTPQFHEQWDLQFSKIDFLASMMARRSAFDMRRGSASA